MRFGTFSILKGNFVLKLIKKGILIILTLLLVHSYIGTLFIYYNNNMYPSIKDGDLCFIQKYDRKYKQDDIVLYENKLYRVIAKENQVVDITDTGILTVDGNQLLGVSTLGIEKGNIELPYTVKTGELFVLNDYYTDTEDSRTLGSIPTTEITGTIVFLFRRRGF